MSTIAPSPWAAAADLFTPAGDPRTTDRHECAADPAVFIERHVHIEDPDGTIVPFTLWDFQRDTLHDLEHHQAVIVLKARRLGLSWVVLAYALWLAIFKQGVRILILCKTGDDAAELLDRIRRMRDRIQDDPEHQHLLHGVVRGAKHRDAVTTLDVGQSTIRALMGTPAAARSETAGLVILDEFGFQRGAAEMWQAIRPTIEGGGRLAVVSTGNGDPIRPGPGQQFAALWTRANSGQSGDHALFFPWQARPDRDQAWYDRTLASIGDPDRMRVEYPAVPDDAFISPDTSFVFASAAIDAAIRHGAALDELLGTPDMPPPAGGELAVGIDWGEHTHAVTIWPLEAGGIYIPPGETVAASREPGEVTGDIIESALRHGIPFTEARYDAAGVQSMRTFVATGRPVIPGLRTVSVPFARFKTDTIGYLRMLFARAQQGHATRVIAISPQNTELIRQLRGVQFDDEDQGKIAKGDDHGFDSLIAGAAPIAHRHRATQE